MTASDMDQVLRGVDGARRVGWAKFKGLAETVGRGCHFECECRTTHEVRYDTDEGTWKLQTRPSGKKAAAPEREVEHLRRQLQTRDDITGPTSIGRLILRDDKGVKALHQNEALIEELHRARLRESSLRSLLASRLPSGCTSGTGWPA